MKNKHFNLTSGIVLILIPLVFSFTGCKDDYETYYEGYGLVICSIPGNITSILKN